MSSSNTRSLFVDDPVVEFGNSFGHIALWTMSFFLLSVSRHTPLLSGGLHRFHIWPGRIIVLCAVFHGMVHMYRWNSRVGASVVAMVVPPLDCWKGSIIITRDVDENCLDPVTGCSCYAKFRNLTGLFAFCGMILIGLTSLYKVRRKYYQIFYLVHISVAPLTMLLLCLHFTRSLIYMAPSVLYYIATSFPVLMEQTTRVRIHSCRQISSKHVQLTVRASDEAMAQYQPGSHVLLRVPSISLVSHPFTVNRVLGESHLLCIMFQETGSLFTKSLSDALLILKKTPPIEMNGFYGSKHLLENISRHDCVIMIAGGIGIVAHLSLLQNLVLAERRPDVKVYWACRDAALIQFIQREYLDPLVIQASPLEKGLLEITIYQTSRDMQCPTFRDEEETAPARSWTSDDNGEPFSPSFFSNSQRGFGKLGTRVVHGMNLMFGTFISWYGCTNALNEEDSAATVWMYVCVVGIIAYVFLVAKRRDSRYLASFSLVVWSGLFVIWYCYLTMQDEFSGILTRLWSPIGVVLLGVMVAVLSVWQTDDLNTVHYTPVDQKSNEQGIELQNCAGHDGIAVDENKSRGQTSRAKNTTSVTECGRPCIESLLQSSIWEKKSLGIFACGPTSLMEDVRIAVRGMKLRSVCRRAGPKSVELYEDTFEK